MFRSAVEFLRTIDTVFPLGSHSNFQDEWSSAALDLAAAHDFDPTETKEIDAVISFRLALQSAAITVQNSKLHQDDSWKWLLTAKQVEQRTPEWYAETRNLLTASEVGRLFEGPGARNSLIRAKSEGQNPIPPLTSPRLAVMREESGPMDWGTRYEPVVKQILETTLGARILDLGRIKHRTIPWVAASPDGLFTSSSTNPELLGRLVEIKCPPTRQINEKVPFDYWCQMQWQMEVCDRPACEYVEVKFRQLKEDDVPNPEASQRGWISLQNNIITDMNRYVYYAYESKRNPDTPWIVLESYQWELLHLRRVTVLRDPQWFLNSQPTFEAFWRDVEAARTGTWIPQAVKTRKAKLTSCAIVDDIDQEIPKSIIVSKDEACP